jgi:deoxycytidine triphosphate deaminase
MESKTMLINPRTAIDNGWVTWNDKITDIEKYIQPNALDFDCSNVMHMPDPEDEYAYLGEDSKMMASWFNLKTTHNETFGDVWYLEQNRCYDFTSNFYVNVPKGVAAELIIRSTLNRNGTFLTSGEYDSGFKGHIAGMLHIRGCKILLAPNTRIGQIKFIQSDSAGMYAGGYNHAHNTHWTATIPNIPQLN